MASARAIRPQVIAKAASTIGDVRSHLTSAHDFSKNDGYRP
jgi:hypothetical protein